MLVAGVLERRHIVLIDTGACATREGVVVDNPVGEPAREIVEVDFDSGRFGGAAGEEDGGREGGGVEGGGGIGGVEEGVEKRVEDEDEEEGG